MVQIAISDQSNTDVASYFEHHSQNSLADFLHHHIVMCTNETSFFAQVFYIVA